MFSTFASVSGLEPVAKTSFGLSREDLQQVAAEKGAAQLQCSGASHQGINADLTPVRSAFTSSCYLTCLF